MIKKPKRTKISFLLCLATFLLQGVVHNQARATSPNNCSRGHLLSHLSAEKQVDLEAFKILGTVPGHHGGNTILIQKKYLWFDLRKIDSDSKLERPELAGDMIVNAQALPTLAGKDFARFFGFEFLDETTMTLPDVKEFNAAIDKFNGSLPDDSPLRIVFRFHEVSGQYESADSYVMAFREHFSIPIAKEGRQRLHDTLSHGVASLLNNSELPRIIHDRVQLWTEFQAELPQRLAKTKGIDEEKIKRGIAQVNKAIASQIDSLGNNIGDFFGQQTRDHWSEQGKAYFSKLDKDVDQDQVFDLIGLTSRSYLEFSWGRASAMPSGYLGLRWSKKDFELRYRATLILDPPLKAFSQMIGIAFPQLQREFRKFYKKWSRRKKPLKLTFPFEREYRRLRTILAERDLTREEMLRFELTRHFVQRLEHFEATFR